MQVLSLHCLKDNNYDYEYDDGYDCSDNCK